MTEDLVQTPNGTFVTREVAEAAGLEVPKPKRTATRKATTRKATTRKPAARKRATTTRKGKA